MQSHCAGGSGRNQAQCELCRDVTPPEQLLNIPKVQINGRFFESGQLPLGIQDADSRIAIAAQCKLAKVSSIFMGLRQRFPRWPKLCTSGREIHHAAHLSKSLRLLKQMSSAADVCGRQALDVHVVLFHQFEQQIHAFGKRPEVNMQHTAFA